VSKSQQKPLGPSLLPQYRIDVGYPLNLKTNEGNRCLIKAASGSNLKPSTTFDNGLSDLINLWSSTATQEVKDSALAHFKEDLEGAVLNWAENRAKSKKYAAVGKELAEFEDVLK